MCYKFVKFLNNWLLYVGIHKKKNMHLLIKQQTHNMIQEHNPMFFIISNY